MYVTAAFEGTTDVSELCLEPFVWCFVMFYSFVVADVSFCVLRTCTGALRQCLVPKLELGGATEKSYIRIHVCRE